MPYIISVHYLEFAIFAIFTYCHFNLCRGVEWVRSFLKNFQTGGGDMETIPSLNGFYVFFLAIELHPHTISFRHFFA